MGDRRRQRGGIGDDGGDRVVVMARAHGMRAWLIQRLSAVYMAGYLVFFLLSLIARPPHGFEAWRGFMTTPLMSIATLLLFLLLLVHAWVGLRDVVMDYVHPFKLRFTVLSLIAGGLIAMGAWVLEVLVRAA
jgi:succinate dehydrogenase / fumarate reductase membrane anchor subunit